MIRRSFYITLSLSVGIGLLLLGLLSACANVIATPSHMTSPSNGETTTPILENSSMLTTTPTTTHGAVPDATFSIATANRTPPEDVLHEIVFGARGGGISPNLNDLCEEESSQLSLDVLPETGLALPFDKIVGKSCGWLNNELVYITLEFPDGKILTDTQRSSPKSAVIYSYQTQLDDPEGLYILRFEGESGMIRKEVHFVIPQEPSKSFLDDQVFLYNLTPYETIRIFVYVAFRTFDDQGGFTYSESQLIAWQEFQANAQGRLFLRLDLGDTYCDENWCDILFRGTVSGDIGKSNVVSSDFIIIPNIVTVPARNGLVDLRVAPNKYSISIAQLTPGTYLWVIGPPSYDDQSFHWWPVRLANGEEGWVFAHDVEPVFESTSLLIPTPILTVMTSPTPSFCQIILEDQFETPDTWSYQKAERLQEQGESPFWYAQIGIPSGRSGEGRKHYSSINRSLSLPDEVANITLRYEAYDSAEEENDQAHVSVKDAAGQSETLWFETIMNTQTWEKRTVDLTTWAGQTVTLYIGVLNNGDDDTAFVAIRDVQIVVCP